MLGRQISGRNVVQTHDGEIVFRSRSGARHHESGPFQNKLVQAGTDTRVARHALGWSPNTSLVDGLSSQLEWVRSRSLATAGR